MEIKKIKNIFFSPNGTTAEVARTIADRFDEPCATLDLIRNPLHREMELDADTLAIVAVPVYAGRIPEPAAAMLKHLKGSGTAVIAVVVYGNRAYEDALLELKDILMEQGFIVISAGAFVAEHSIFPKTAAGRPDSSDLTFIQSFAENSKNVLANAGDGSGIRLRIPGGRPYRAGGRVTLVPKTSRGCTKCGICADLCPTGAIMISDTSVTDPKLCIACGACIHNCPEGARRFGGFLYRSAARAFLKKYSMRKEPEAFYSEPGI